MKFALALIAFAFSSHALASDIISSKVPVTRGGKVQTRVAYQFWSGEYPGPVVDVNSRAKGKTTKVQAYKSLRDKSGKASCEIKNGLYHPWSEDKTSVREYYSLTGLAEYVAERDVTIMTADGESGQDLELKIKQGSKLTEIIYFGEGLNGAVVEDGSSRKPISFFFQVLDEVKGLKQISKPGDFNEQWIRVKCADGQKLFAEVNELLTTKGVQEGTITGYGSVGPAQRK